MAQYDIPGDLIWSTDNVYDIPTLLSQRQANGLDAPAVTWGSVSRKVKWMRFGGNEQQLMDLAGWESEEMLRLYVQAGSLEDLLTAHRKSGPVDNLLR